MIISRPINHSEIDLLIGNEHQCLIIKDLEGKITKEIYAPQGGYTHELLELIDYFIYSPNGWDAYLGDGWIGSSEI